LRKRQARGGERERGGEEDGRGVGGGLFAGFCDDV